MKNRVAIITPLGAEPRLDNYAEFLLAQGLQKRGYRVQFYTYRMRHNPAYIKNGLYQNIIVKRCRQRLGISLSLFFSILAFRPRYVVFFHPRSYLNFSAYLAGRLAGAKIYGEIVGILHDPFIVADRDDPLNSFHKNIDLIVSPRQLLKKIFSTSALEYWKNFLFHYPAAHADAIIAISQDERDYIKKFYGRDSVLIPWAMPVQTAMSEHQPDEKKFGLMPHSFLFFIGMIKKRKGWDTVLEALALLKKQGIQKSLVFVSPMDPGEAKAYAQNLGILDQITFCIKVSNEEKNWLYSHCDAVLAPSRYEGFGLPVFEAFRSQKPLLATAIPVYQEFLSHKKNALLSQPGDPVGLAENIKLLDADANLKKQLVSEGLKTAGAYTDDIMVEKFLILFNSV